MRRSPPAAKIRPSARPPGAAIQQRSRSGERLRWTRARRGAPLLRRRRASRGLKVGRGRLAGAPVGLQLVGDLLTLHEAAHPCPLDGADVDEDVLAAVVRLDKAVALLVVEPLH